MPYENLTDDQLLEFAEAVHDRAQPATLHTYVSNVRTLVNGKDAISIPDTHRKLLRGENHEGSIALNRRIRQLASWFSRASVRFSVQAAGPGDVVQRGATMQERFAFRGEQQLARGSGLHRWKQESHRDLAECGVMVTQQHARRDFYLKVGETPNLMANGALLRDVVWRRRVDPASFGWIEDPYGDLGLVTVRTGRHLGEIAAKTDLATAKRVLGYFDFGEGIDPEHPDSWTPAVTIQTVEVWGANNGGLVVVGGPSSATAAYTGDARGRILARWRHRNGRPPFYVAAPSTWPWHSPLDEMVQFTNIRNFWATMLDLQASGAIFRHWQLTDTNDGSEVLLQRDAVPEHLKFDLSKPPPHMGPGTRWELSPFEFHDVTARYENVRAEHEAAGASVARLVGQTMNQNTPVGTADIMNDSAMDEFAEWIEAIKNSKEELWRDYFRWHRTVHKDPISVFDMKRDIEGPKVGAFINTRIALTADDITSEFVEATLDTRNRIQKAADFRLAVEAISAGMMDYDRAVNAGYIPDVDDPEAEKLAIMVSEAERIEANVELQALGMRAAQAAGLMEPPTTSPRFLEGKRTDPRSLGAGQGADNVANTAMAPGASDMLRKTA